MVDYGVCSVYFYPKGVLAMSIVMIGDNATNLLIIEKILLNKFTEQIEPTANMDQLFSLMRVWLTKQVKKH